MSRFQHHDFGAAFAQFLCHYAAGSAGADNADVEAFVFCSRVLPYSRQ